MKRIAKSNQKMSYFLLIIFIFVLLNEMFSYLKYQEHLSLRGLKPPRSITLIIMSYFNSNIFPDVTISIYLVELVIAVVCIILIVFLFFGVRKEMRLFFRMNVIPNWRLFLGILVFGILILMIFPSIRDEDLSSAWFFKGRAAYISNGFLNYNNAPNTVGYTLFLTVIYSFFGYKDAVVIFFNQLLYLISALLIFLLTFILFKKKSLSFITGLIFLLIPPVVIFSGTGDYPLFMIFWLILSFIIIILFFKSKSKNLLLLAIFMMTYAVYIRYEFFLLWIIVVPLMFLVSVKRKKISSSFIIFMIVFFLFAFIPTFYYITFSNSILRDEQEIGIRDIPKGETSFSIGRFFTNFPYFLKVYSNIFISPYIFLFFCLIILLNFTLMFRQKNKHDIQSFALLLLSLLIILAIYIGTKVIERYLIVSIPFFLLLLVGSINKLMHHFKIKVSKVVRQFFFVLLIGFLFLNLYVYYNQSLEDYYNGYLVEEDDFFEELMKLYENYNMKTENYINGDLFDLGGINKKQIESYLNITAGLDDNPYIIVSSPRGCDILSYNAYFNCVHIADRQIFSLIQENQSLYLIYSPKHIFLGQVLPDIGNPHDSMNYYFKIINKTYDLDIFKENGSIKIYIIKL